MFPMTEGNSLEMNFISNARVSRLREPQPTDVTPMTEALEVRGIEGNKLLLY